MSIPALKPGKSRITGRMQGGWIVGGRLYMPALLVTAEVVGTIPGLSFATLDLMALPEMEMVELLLLGTGATLRMPTEAMLEAALKRRWRIEAMDNSAAARTFNVLAMEERLVGALLLADEAPDALRQAPGGASAGALRDPAAA